MRISSNAVRSPVTVSATTVTALVDALRSEARLLGDLGALMRRQRDAVSRDDLDAVDDSVFGTHRILLTLSEARRRRRSINHMLGEGDDLSIGALDDFFAGAIPRDVRTAADQLSEAARTLQREVEVNRRILRRAIAEQQQRPRSGGSILDRTV
jgi:hypothetical protein